MGEIPVDQETVSRDWFVQRTVRARFVAPSGDLSERPIQIRTHPITGRTCRIAFSRIEEEEAGIDRLPEPPPDARQIERCPFCRPQVLDRTPRLAAHIHPDGRMVRGEALLFPNLFPYGAYSAVSLFDNAHFVEIGTASAHSYADCLINCADYLKRVIQYDPAAIHMAITQNHLPSAGGSMVHPHLQIQADRVAANHHRGLLARARAYRRATGRNLLSDYVARESRSGERIIGRTGPWLWLAAFAPEGFFEIWAVFSGCSSILAVAEQDWRHLAAGMIRVQQFYRSLNRNGYNFGLLSVETPQSALELRAVMLVRSNYAPWTRSDHTGFEVMLGDMATFSAPEETARLARAFWPANAGHRMEG
ncbi:MAG TPA: galactose-1-phosphate uridylyltransferase [Desulfosarcina sp.]|nr:galactose-1-phosphate uridylyltransferase [Desulfosarcina sp.]